MIEDLTRFDMKGSTGLVLIIQNYGTAAGIYRCVAFEAQNPIRSDGGLQGWVFDRFRWRG